MLRFALGAAVRGFASTGSLLGAGAAKTLFGRAAALASVGVAGVGVATLSVTP